MAYRSNGDRFNLSIRTPRPDKTTAYLFRPGQYYSLTRLGDSPFVIESNRQFSPEASEAIVSSPFSANDDISKMNGLGHGLLISGIDWYSAFASDTLPIVSVAETSHDGKPCYKVVAGEIEEARRTNNVAYFDKNNFMVFLYFYTFNPPGKSPVTVEEVVEYESKGDNYRKHRRQELQGLF